MAEASEEEYDEEFSDEEDGDFAAVVVDIGSGLIKAGFAGDDAPRAVFPSIVGRPRKNAVKFNKDITEFCGDEALCHKTTVQYPVERGVVQKWDDMKLLLTHTFEDELRIEAEENVLLLSEPPMNPHKNREKMAEILFEEFNCPAIHVSNQSVLALYASARTTGMVVDSGDGVTHFAPIYEGMIQDHAAKRFDIAGRDITEFLQKLLNGRGEELNTTLEKELIRDCKEHLCFVSSNYEMDLKKPDSEFQETYRLPDGRKLNLGQDRFKCTEILFRPHDLLDIDRDGVHELAYKSIQECDIDLRKEMRENIVLCGGTTMLKGFDTRLKKELDEFIGGSQKVRIAQQEPLERNYAVWIGGSILSSVDNFQDMCLTKEDFEEDGPKSVHARFDH